MASWIYVFSKFTPEALLFEALIICLLCASYAAFWVLRKRKYGVLGPDSPAYAVKSYLSQLILDAEQMRIQLFGLLAGNGVDPNVIAALRAASAGGATASAGAATMPAISAAAAAAAAADPAVGAKLVELETKMVEQAKVIETITNEKTRVETELVQLRSAKGGGGASAPVDNSLLEKIKLLEAKLAEYSVIEDDLANLKRLQQENAALKAQLGGKAPAAAAAAPAPAPAAAPTPAPAAAAPAAEPEPEIVPVAEAASAEPEPAVEAPEQAAAEAVAATDNALAEAASAAATAVAEPIAAPTQDPGFEGLVDQVEQSLAPEAAPAGASVTDPMTPQTAQPTQVTAPPTAAPPPPEKSDADLVAEFEKMLNS